MAARGGRRARQALLRRLQRRAPQPMPPGCRRVPEMRDHGGGAARLRDRGSVPRPAGDAAEPDAADRRVLDRRRPGLHQRPDRDRGLPGSRATGASRSEADPSRAHGARCLSPHRPDHWAPGSLLRGDGHRRGQRRQRPGGCAGATDTGQIQGPPTRWAAARLRLRRP